MADAGPLDVAWLAGLIDGDGGISFLPYKSRTGLSVCVVNSDEAIARKAEKVLKQLGVDPRVRTMIRYGRKPIYRVEATTLEQVRKLLTAVKPYLTGNKAARATLMLEFVDIRQRARHRQPYSSREYTIIAMTRDLRQRPGPRAEVN